MNSNDRPCMMDTYVDIFNCSHDLLQHWHFSILKEEKNRNRADLWTNKTERLLGEKWKNSCVHTNSKTIIITRTITWTKNTDTVEHALLMPDVQKPCLLAHFVCIVSGLSPLFSLCPPGHGALYPRVGGWVGWAGKLPSCLRSRLTSLFSNLHSCCNIRMFHPRAPESWLHDVWFHFIK